MTTQQNRTAKYLVFLGAALTFCACATTERDWQLAESLGSISSYEQFLKNHPDAEQSNQAKRNLAILQAKLQIDEDWKKATAENTIDGYNNFIGKHPQSEFSFWAKQWSKKLQIDEDWEKVKSGDTIEGYNNFLEKYSLETRSADYDATTWMVKERYVIQAKNELEIVESLANGSYVNKNGYPLLSSASSRGDKARVEFLINKGADINMKDSDFLGRSALHEAVLHDHEDIVELLLDNRRMGSSLLLAHV